MAADRMALGVRRVGYVVNTDEPNAVVSLTFTDDGVEAIWPRALSFFEAFERNKDESRDYSWLVFRDSSGALILRGGSSAGLSMSTLGVSQQIIHFKAAIASGANAVGYEQINGMTSEIEGLATWSKLSAVTTKLRWAEEVGLEGITLEAANKPVQPLGGPFGLRLVTSYWHQPRPADGDFVIRDRLHVETRTTETFDWDEHAAQHRMLQDLMSLVYGAPCQARLRSVMRDDDQPEAAKGDRRWWPEAYEPTFGRQPSSGDPPKPRREPLFFLDETDSARVERWVADPTRWSRPVGIAATTLFQSGSTAESLLLQVGVALEALGYAIWREASDGDRTPTFPRLLEYVTDAVDLDSEDLYGPGRRAPSWRRDFNDAFKGAKHADRPLPVAADAIRWARAGLLVIRAWLATELGVDRVILEKRLKEVRGGLRA